MSYWIDLKYLKLLNLEKFTSAGDGKYNFRCPVCGDSKENSNKKRGWALTYNNSIFIKCFNCEHPYKYFPDFLKNFFPNIYSEYLTEKIKEKDVFSTRNKPKENSIDIFAQEYDSLTLQKIKDLPNNHLAVQYLKDRKLYEYAKEFYYTDEFSYWVHENIDSSLFSSEKFKDPRIVIPFFNKKKKIFAVQGRAIKNQRTKYLTVKMDKSEDKLFGLSEVDFNKQVYLLEGAFDSFFIDNSLAFSGSLSDIEQLLKYTIKNNIVIIPDNDRNNIQTNKFIEQALSKDFKVVIWPNNLPFKDLNEAIIKGFSKKEIKDIIDQNTFKGIKGISKFKMRSL